MNFVLTVASATSATLYVVALFKRAFPAAASRSVVGCAVLSGILLSFLAALAQGTPMNLQNAAISFIGGIGAAAAAAGVRSEDNKADEQRQNPGA